jgi:hypothetical protein
MKVTNSPNLFKTKQVYCGRANQKCMVKTRLIKRPLGKGNEMSTNISKPKVLEILIQHTKPPFDVFQWVSGFI